MRSLQFKTIKISFIAQQTIAYCVQTVHLRIKPAQLLKKKSEKSKTCGLILIKLHIAE